MASKKPSKKVSLKNLVLRGATWWFRRRRADAAGKITEEYFSLDTRDLHEALAKRDAHLAGLGSRAATSAGAATGIRVATIGEVIDSYRDSRCGGAVREQTRKVNAQCLLNFIRRAFALDDNAAARALPVDRIDATAVRRYQESFFGPATARDALAAGVATTNANSILLKARSVFAHPQIFEGRRDWSVPEITAFRTVKPLDDKNFKRRIAFQPLSQDEGKKLLEALVKLRASHPRLYLFIALMFRCGLRNSEAAAITRAWIVRMADGATAVSIEFRADFQPKTPSSCRLVAIPPDLLADMQAITGFTFTDADPSARAGEFITTPELSPTKRRDFSIITANAWLQSILPDRECYDLRKQAGSMMAHAFGDIREAQKFLGHASQTTTETYYAKSLTSLKLAPIAFAEA